MNVLHNIAEVSGSSPLPPTTSSLEDLPFRFPDSTKRSAFKHNQNRHACPLACIHYHSYEIRDRYPGVHAKLLLDFSGGSL